ncbi:MAG: bifunctional riboflavin kinase/FAD synthetase [Tepidisphaera sp.]|nr:bifunctional riboflavin kinase/FAD synthetase [Tepidisphaera sp.]
MPPTALTIGTFDGVHVGHAALLARCRHHAGPGGRVIAMVFDPHPLTALRPDAAPARLSTFEQREAWLKAAGADEVHRLLPTPDQLDLSPHEFAHDFATRFAPTWVVEGFDFRFGKGRQGDVLTLDTLGRQMNFQVDVLPPVEVALSDQLIVRASSSLARWLINGARAADAAIVLGRPYELVGEVRRGDRRGRTIGFPTANLSTDLLLPADGVYAADAILPDGRQARAAMNIGTRPTFSGHERRAEIHILDLPRDPQGSDSSIPGLPEYHWPLRVRLLAFLRDQVKFASIDALTSQLQRDIARARAWQPHAFPAAGGTGVPPVRELAPAPSTH